VLFAAESEHLSGLKLVSSTVENVMSNNEESSNRPTARKVDIGTVYWISLAAILVMVASIFLSTY
jgi:hypothetical protein